ncbi:colicin E3/pyocin S6 family cytotoxin [Bradyrhizobium sp. CW10]|uniref:colicin E3/pyocin S6 family cytotoxin n=1 Tax=Bradyrhizobium sp. CW10 TaxID=2782683 RepID=UPI0031F8FCC1|nr:hypothetical protein [Bradyrhizobium sp. CW10]
MSLAFLGRAATTAFAFVLIATMGAPSAKAGALTRALERSWVAAGAVAIGGYLGARAVQCAQDPSVCPGEQRLRDRVVDGLANAVNASPGYRVGAFSDYMEDTSVSMGYHPPPRGSLAGFPGSVKVPGKLRGAGGKIRPRWDFPDGTFGEWDWQHGEVEVYDKRGRHKGAYDPDTGEKKKPAVPGREAEK